MQITANVMCNRSPNKTNEMKEMKKGKTAVAAAAHVVCE